MLEGVACLSGTVIGWVLLDAGVEVITVISRDPQFNAIGESKRRIVPSPK